MMPDVIQMLRAAALVAKEGRAEEAAEKFLEVVAVAEDDPRGWFGAGVCLARSGKMDEAREALEEAERRGHPKAKDALDRLSASRLKRAPESGGKTPPASTTEAKQKAAPVAKASARPVEREREPLPKIDLGKRVRIMLIEDRVEDREAVTKALNEGITSVEVMHSPFAESASRTIVGLGIFDIAIMDWNTNPAAAKELLDFLKLKQPHIPVIVLTRGWSEEMARNAIRAGADYCLVKASGYARILPSVIEQRFKQSFAVQEKLLSEISDPAFGWRKYFEAMRAPALLLDQEGKVLDVNLATVSLLHEPRDRLTGRPCEKLFGHGPEADSFFPLNEAFGTGEPVSVERNEPELGRQFRVTVHRVADEDQVQYVCALEDASGVGAAGATPGPLLSKALDQIDQQIFYVDVNGRFLYANEAYAKTIALRPEQLIGRTESELKPGAEAQEHVAQIKEVAERGDPASVERRREGRWCEYRLLPVKEGMATVGVLGVGSDVTDLRSKLAQDGSSAVGTLADLAGDMAFELDQKGMLTFLNRNASDVCGRHPSEVVGHQFSELVQESARARWQEMFDHVRTSGEAVAREELSLRRPDGTTFYGEVSLTAVSDAASGQVTALRGVLRDFSARRRVEKALRLLSGAEPLD